MQRFNALSELYTRVGFHRKAAFFKRVAAMRCVSPSNPHPNWNLCHSLLLQLLDGYSVSLDPNEHHRFGFYGWSRLQIQVMQELVGTAKRKGNNALATRHMTLLLHTMLPHVSLSTVLLLLRDLCIAAVASQFPMLSCKVVHPFIQSSNSLV
jgi:hypothetical protein